MSQASSRIHHEFYHLVQRWALDYGFKHPSRFARTCIALRDGSGSTRCHLYVLTDANELGFWGLRENTIQRLKSFDVPWLAVLLYAANDGYAVTKDEIVDRTGEHDFSAPYQYGGTSYKIHSQELDDSCRFQTAEEFYDILRAVAGLDG
jgi:hypothetical protein